MPFALVSIQPLQVYSEHLDSEVNKLSPKNDMRAKITDTWSISSERNGH